MLVIYKKLPKTNCGKCGSATCMAFAMAVKKGAADLSRCPFVDGDTSPGLKTGSPISSPLGYEHVAEEIEKEALSLDFRQAAEAVGGEYITCDGREAIRLKMISKAYELYKEGLFENNVYSSDTWARIIICDYIRRRAIRPHSGELIGLGHFPNTASHVKAFQSNAERKITDTFKDNADKLRRRCTELGGFAAQNNLKADYSFSFDLLPNIPLFIFFWSADEEFEADCKILFDRSAEDYIDIEYLANLLERFTLELTGEVRQPF